MENFKSLELKPVYRTGTDNLYNDFYKKVLSKSIQYDRAVGYFSSELLTVSLQGISSLIKNNGKMRLIIGYPLSNEEYKAVQDGMLLKDLLTEATKKLESILESDSAHNITLKFLTYLIATDKLSIKFAFRTKGMYHEKIGVFRDHDSNKIVFQGSANETPHGMLPSLNAESISVYTSWHEEIYALYGSEFERGFEELWLNKQSNTTTIEIPSDFYTKISTKYETIEFNINLVEEEEEEFVLNLEQNKALCPSIPENINGNSFNIYEHQLEALRSWKSASFKGIFKLATGSGKTITSIYGAVKTYESRKAAKQKLFVIIAVPYIELAKQWVENLNLFNIHPHQCYNTLSSWKHKLEKDINFFKAGSIDFCCALVVNKTLSSKNFQSLISRLESNDILFIGDECHRHASSNLRNSLPDAFYRMGLSATPYIDDDDEREGSFINEAKENLTSYYGNIESEYSLERAILEGVLTPYEYNIVPIYLTEEEQNTYDYYSNKISQILIRSKGRKLSKDDKLQLTINSGQRSRLIGGATNKLEVLRKLTSNKTNEEKKHCLFYVGEGKAFLSEDNDEFDQKIINSVASVLEENNWNVAEFTSNVNSFNREKILREFKDKTFDALIAMKVLDEGIDVPACKTAYIMASTKNPRQYVQRRGRILRKSKNKTRATIYDFVVLPYGDSPFGEGLKKSELERINDFVHLAINKSAIEIEMRKLGLTYEYS